MNSNEYVNYSLSYKIQKKIGPKQPTWDKAYKYTLKTRTYKNIAINDIVDIYIKRIIMHYIVLYAICIINIF